MTISPQIVHDHFKREHRATLFALSKAATAYAEAAAPALLLDPPPALRDYLNRTISMVFCHEAPRRQPIVLADGYGIFPPLQQILLSRPVVAKPEPVLTVIDMATPAGVALEAALVAMAELLARVDAAAGMTVEQFNKNHR